MSCAADDRLLLVPILDGIGDLSRAASLQAHARELWRQLRTGASPSVLSEWLAHTAGISSERARADVAAFLRDLEKHGILTGPVRQDDSGAGAEDTLVSRIRQVDAVDEVPEIAALVEPSQSGATLELLVRAVVDAGFRVRFVAHGLSMRPQLPHGSMLEVSPRGFEDLRIGDIALYSTPQHRLVAHRLVGCRGGVWLARGDSAARLDHVDPVALIGVVTARVESDGRSTSLDHRMPRLRGLISGFFHRCRTAALRLFFVRPLRASSWLRRLLRACFAFVSRVLRSLETRSTRLRRRIDVGRAALMSEDEKDHDRRQLYSRKSIQDFTALDENVEAGLTMIEELLLRRHPIVAGCALVLGCGPGRESVALAKLGFDVTGIDREDAMLDHARALAARESVDARFLRGEVDAFDLDVERFETVVIFSGLYNMLLPRSRRVAMLRQAFRHLHPGGRVLVTFLSDYCTPGRPAPPRQASGVWSAVNPEHEEGDLYLWNEAVHIFPHSEQIEAEARSAGFTVDTLFRDQRAYDRSARQVRGYAILVRPVEDGGE